MNIVHGADLRKEHIQFLKFFICYVSDDSCLSVSPNFAGHVHGHKTSSEQGEERKGISFIGSNGNFVTKWTSQFYLLCQFAVSVIDRFQGHGHEMHGHKTSHEHGGEKEEEEEHKGLSLLSSGCG